MVAPTVAIYLEDNGVRERGRGDSEIQHAGIQLSKVNVPSDCGPGKVIHFVEPTGLTDGCGAAPPASGSVSDTFVIS